MPTTHTPVQGVLWADLRAEGTRRLDRDVIYRYVRRVPGALDRWQARIWLGDEHGHLSLGTWPSEREAWIAARDYLRRGLIPAHVLPKYVRRSGSEFIAITSRRRRTITLGPFPTPDAAHRAMVAELAGLPPANHRRRRVRAGIASHSPKR